MRGRSLEPIIMRPARSVTTGSVGKRVKQVEVVAVWRKVWQLKREISGRLRSSFPVLIQVGAAELTRLEPLRRQ